ncbi:ParA family protein, partial [Phreatobacter sp.]|uniref:ParA family protein n=1 Tax=Phreatobacter sp. TaxID=1966341 RepID=UPI003F72352A
TGLGLARGERGAGTYAMLIEGRRLAELIRPTAVPNLSLLPSDQDLAGAEIELVALTRREYRLRDALAAAPPGLVLIDC